MNFSSCVKSVPLAFLALALATGCGTGEYDRRFDATMAAYRSRPKPKFDLSQFNKLRAENAIGNDDINFRIPRAFLRLINAGNIASFQTQAGRKAERFPAGEISLPGHMRTGQAEVNASDKTVWPYYLYLCAQKAPAGKLNELCAEVTKQFRAISPKSLEDWQDVEIVTLTGNVLATKKLRVKGPMPFLKLKKNELLFYDGVIEIYAFEVAGYQVMVGTECMEMYEEFLRLPDMLEVTVQTLWVSPRAESEAAIAAAGANAETAK